MCCFYNLLPTSGNRKLHCDAPTGLSMVAPGPSPGPPPKMIVFLPFRDCDSFCRLLIAACKCGQYLKKNKLHNGIVFFNCPIHTSHVHPTSDNPTFHGNRRRYSHFQLYHYWSNLNLTFTFILYRTESLHALLSCIECHYRLVSKFIESQSFFLRDAF